ncbi:MAG TPA: hypothetical protein VH599_16970 [Ktedonobacterales bacterium]|jgi:hypothetical protein
MRVRSSSQYPKKYGWLAIVTLIVLLQACGDNNDHFSSNGNPGGVGTNQTVKFTGSMLFVKDGNLLVLHGADESVTQLTSNRSAAQPSVSHDGSTIAFELHKPGSDYSNLATMPLAGGTVTPHTDNRLLCKCDPDKSGVFHYQFWAGNPIWSSDDKQIIYLSDFYKGGRATPRINQTCPAFSIKDSIQDLAIVETPANARALPAISSSGHANPPKLLAWPYCYAGGDQDLSLRPGVSDTEILFTGFRYVGSQNDLVAQVSVLIIPRGGGPYRVIQLSPPDPKILSLEPSWSPDGKYITYIRRENGQDNLYIMAVDAAIQNGIPNTLAGGGPEEYLLIGAARAKYYTNTTYYDASHKLAEGIIGQPTWGDQNQLFFMEFRDNLFDLFLAKVKFTAPAPAASATPGAAPTPTATPPPGITLDGDPIQLTRNGIDGASRPVWLSA